jgi:hypothetical protein
MRSRLTVALLSVLAAATAAAGCGSSGSSSSGGSATSGSNAASQGALSAEAQSAATGDIPDSQVFVTLQGVGYSMRYPEGWVRRGAGSDVTLQDKNNQVHVVVRRGGAPPAAAVAAELQREQRATPSLKPGAPQTVSLGKQSAVKVTYSTESAPNQVTGKRVVLMVDRYVVPGPGGRYAIVDLGSPKGVDNVDAYRMMIRSFQWR